jgi:ADP-ribosylglycohydrolase
VEPIERYRGSLLGLAAGDAVGVAVESMAPGSFEPLTDMVGAVVFGLEPGQWTDDTSLGLCLADSLIKCRGFDPLVFTYVDMQKRLAFIPQWAY